MAIMRRVSDSCSRGGIDLSKTNEISAVDPGSVSGAPFSLTVER